MTSRIDSRREIFVVVTNSDLTEGRGFPVYLHWCWFRTTAKRLARKKGVMGSDAEVKEMWCYEVDGVWCVPIVSRQIESPTNEDTLEDKEIKEATEIIERLKAAGFAGSEIAKVAKSVGKIL